LNLLFGTPTLRGASFAITISLIVTCGLTALYLLTEPHEGAFFFCGSMVLLVFHALATIVTTRLNLLYLFRYFLVWILIAIAASVYFIFDGKVLLHYLGERYQSLENTKILVAAGLYSLCGSLIGWHASLKRVQIINLYKHDGFLTQSKYLLRFGLIFAFFFGLLYLWKVGGPVTSQAGYASDAGVDFTFGVFSVFHFIGIALLLIAGVTPTGLQKKYIAFGIISLIPGLLAGSRADFLPQACLLTLLILGGRIENTSGRTSFSQILSLSSLGIILLLVGFLLASVTAVWRTGDISFLSAISEIANLGEELFIRNLWNKDVFFIETGNQMLGGLYSAIVQVKEGYTGFLMGESYFNYILMTPPAFLNLERPLGLEWLTAVDGEALTQGGIFEVAEAYWNFGFIGCFIISLAVSFLFGTLLRKGINQSNYFFLTWYIVFGLHGFRAIWYQNFVYFRIATVMLLVWGLSYFYLKWFIRNHGAIDT
jgi:hypothetical protein